MKNSDFVFIGDLLDYPSEEQINLGYEFYLLRPNEEQIEIIQKNIHSYFDLRFGRYFNRYEQKEITLEKNQWKYDQIQSYKDFKYSIIRMPKNYDNYLSALEITMNISELDLNQIFRCHYMLFTDPETGDKTEEGGIGKRISTSMFNYYFEFSNDFVLKKIDKNLTNNFKEVFELVYNFQKNRLQYPFIDKVLSDFQKIKDIPFNSPFKMVALISCLELLLTDSSPDKLISINKQLQKKINLLNNRFEKKIDFSTYIKGPNTLILEKIIEKIYEYRSSIAHGSTIDFQKSLSIFSAIEFKSILEFVNVITQKIIIQAIKEPQLVDDLKKC